MTVIDVAMNPDQVSFLWGQAGLLCGFLFWLIVIR